MASNDQQLILYHQEKAKLLDFQLAESRLKQQIAELSLQLIEANETNKPQEYKDALQAQIDQLNKSLELATARVNEQDLYVTRLSMDENGGSIVNTVTGEVAQRTEKSASTATVGTEGSLPSGETESESESAPSAIETSLPDERAKLQTEAKRYGFIFGGDLIVSYFRLYGSNRDNLNKYKVADNKDVEVQPKDNQVVRVGTPISVPIDKEQTKEPDESEDEPEPEVQDDPEATYASAKEPTPVAKEAAKEAKKVIGEEGAKAVLAHSNVKTFFQRFWPLSGETKTAIAVGVGIFGIADKVLKQSSNTPKPTFNPAAVTRTPSNPSATVLSYKQNLKASNDPRLDPIQAGKISATLSSELAKDLKVAPKELHPDIHAYVLQMGPKDPVLLASLKEIDPTDQSQATGMKLAQVIKRRMVVHGGYSKAEVEYVDNYRAVKEMADTKGLHSLN